MEAAQLASLVSGLPQRFDRLLKTTERGEMQVRADVSGIDKYINHIEQLVTKAVIIYWGRPLLSRWRSSFWQPV